MNYKFPFIFFLFIIPFFLSCGKRTTDELLKEAEHYMSIRLDSVNLILDKISHPEELKGKQQIIYCRMKSRCEGYVLSQWEKSDSLNRICMDYYLQQQDTSVLANETLFSGLTNIKLERFDKAKIFIEKYIDYSTQLKDNGSRSYGYYLLSEIYLSTKQPEIALKFSKIGLQLVDHCDTILQGNYNRHIAGIYGKSELVDSAMEYYSKSLKYFTSIRDWRIGEIYDEIAKMYLSAGNYEKAINYVELGMQSRSKRKEIASFNLTKARIFIMMNEQDSARFYLKRTIESSENEYITLIAYRYLSDTYKIVGNNEQAHNQLLNYKTHFERQEMVLSSDILRDQYGKLVLENENNELKLAKREWELYLLTIILVVFVLVVILWLLFLNDRKKKDKQLQLHKEQILKGQTYIAEKENLLLKNENELVQLREKAAVMRESLFRKMAVTKKIPSLDATNSKDKINKRISLDEQDWNEVIQTVNASYGGFVNKLKKEYPGLSINDIAFCCLVKIDVSLQDLADIYCISKAGITKKKTRMKKDKFNIVDETVSLDDFLISY